jgi:anhydro-N-acetylmuramic acid kinase
MTSLALPPSKKRAPDPAPRPELYVGVMSGTSLDGVDAVAADFSGEMPRILAAHHVGFPAALRDDLMALQASGADELHRSSLAALGLARCCARAIRAAMRSAGISADAVRAAGVHGQTVRHRPESGYTIQLHAGALVAELAGVDVITDFRSRDVAAGGQGAPLVPAFHAAVFRSGAPRAVLNLGGIANFTFLPAFAEATAGATPAVATAKAGRPVTGFDCGPGNVLLDLWAQRHLGEPFDRDGAWAAQGRCDEELLRILLSEPFLKKAPPRSTGRDLFHEGWLVERLALRAGAPALRPVDVQATLAEFTACAAGEALRNYGAGATEVIACGGGTYNGDLMRRLAAQFAPRPLRSSGELGIDPRQVEALAFAWLARQYMLGKAAGLPGVTGAKGERVLGARYPR